MDTFYVDHDQAYYWTYTWQAGERETLKELAAGGARVFSDPAAAIQYLASRPSSEDQLMNRFMLRLRCAWHVLRDRPLLYGMTFRGSFPESETAAGLFVAGCTVLAPHEPYDMSHIHQSD